MAFLLAIPLAIAFTIAISPLIFIWAVFKARRVARERRDARKAKFELDAQAYLWALRAFRAEVQGLPTPELPFAREPERPPGRRPSPPAGRRVVVIAGLIIIGLIVAHFQGQP
jgi:hypothetical protein